MPRPYSRFHALQFSARQFTLRSSLVAMLVVGAFGGIAVVAGPQIWAFALQVRADIAGFLDVTDEEIEEACSPRTE